MSDPIYTQGISGGVQPRLEINDLIKNPYQFSLYVQAIERMYATDQTNPRSHFQIGGIHGKPYKPWDRALPDNKPVNDKWGGYCTHGTVTFPTWHRPYVVLFEQILQQHALDIAKEYTAEVRGQFTEAAETLRAPFWDWADSSSTVPPPQVISDSHLSILYPPNGEPLKVNNPLLKYTFHPVDPSFDGPIFTSKTTLRHPILKQNTKDEYESDVDALRKLLQTEADHIMYKTHMMFTCLHTWPLFSLHVATEEEQTATANSLESIHNSIHRAVGGAKGHMNDPSMAGFDPIFFLHHTNVDRLLSFWSALNPGVWVTPGQSGDGSITIPPNTQVDANTPMTPFRSDPQDSSECWASAQLVTTEQFGYTYPSLSLLTTDDPRKSQHETAKHIGKLYGKHVLGSLTLDDTGASGKDSANTIHDWTARVRVKQYETGASFSVLIFIGDKIPEGDGNKRLSDTYVGSFDTFVNSDAGRCENCARQREQNVVVEGFVHLNLAIAKLYESQGPGSYHPRVIKQFLKNKGIKWCIEKADGSIVVPDENSSLKVDVMATPLTLLPDASIPQAGEPVFYNDILTDGPGSSPDD